MTTGILYTVYLLYCLNNPSIGILQHSKPCVYCFRLDYRHLNENKTSRIKVPHLKTIMAHYMLHKKCLDNILGALLPPLCRGVSDELVAAVTVTYAARTVSLFRDTC